MKMEHYLSHTDYPIWKVIQNGNGHDSVTTDINGIIKVLAPKTAKEVMARERERKARNTLLMALPEDHLAKFHKMADAKEMWEAIKSRFSTTASSSNTENVEFVSAKNTSSTNDISTAYSVSSPSILKSQMEGSSSYTDEINDDDDMEEIDLKWQVAMISMRIKKFHKRTGRKLSFDTKDLVDFDKTKLECFNCHKIGHSARDCRAKGNQDSRRRDVGYNGNKTRDNGIRPAYQDDSKTLVTIDGEDIDWPGHVEEDAQNYVMMAYSFRNLGISPPMTGNYMPSGPDVEIDYFKFTYETSTSMPEPIENASKVVCEPKVWTDAPIIEEYNSALTASLTIRTSCIKQFWTTAKVKTTNDEVRIQALIDEKRVNIKESSNHRTLKLDDAEGTFCLANAEIFNGLVKMGYEKLSEKLTFYKAFLSPQWKFLTHTILHKELTCPKQMALGKDISNPLMAGSSALTASLTIRTSCIKQFWTTAKVKTTNDEVRIQALIDEKRVNIKESSNHRTLKLDDAEGTFCLANAEIFNGLVKMGYEKLSEKLTFYKAFLSPQWNLVKNIEAGVPFFMFPRFVKLLIDHQMSDMSHHKDIYDNPSLTKKVFANIKRVGTGFSGLVTPFFDYMLVLAAKEVRIIQNDVQSISIPTEPSTSKTHKKHKPKKHQTQAPKVPSPEPLPKHRLPSPSNDPLPGGKDSLKLKELMDLCTHLSNKVLELESKVIDIKSTNKERIEKLEGRVDRRNSFKHGRIIANIDEDNDINLEEAQAKSHRMDLEHPKKVLSMQDVDDEEPTEVKEVLEVVTTAKLITKVVTTAGATTTAEATKVSVLRRKRGVVIQDLKETTSTVVVHSEVQSKDKGKVMKYQALKRKPLTEAQARKNMIIYLKNMVGYKMNYFKGMTYSEIRPLFEKHYNYNQAFLEEVNKEVIIPKKEVEVVGYKSEGKSLEKGITKKQKMDEEAEELKSYLQIVSNNDDDVYTEATPLALKIPIIDYKIYLERNKP
nr:ribonuclease H-like domain-containing protein [Tanacetum cinerariifolium]